MRFINDIRKQFSTNKMETYPFSSIYWHKIYLPYIKRIKVVKPLNYMPFIKSEAMEFLQKEYDWKPNWNDLRRSEGELRGQDCRRGGRGHSRLPDVYAASGVCRRGRHRSQGCG